jgi:hypothetical protein
MSEPDKDIADVDGKEDEGFGFDCDGLDLHRA